MLSKTKTITLGLLVAGLVAGFAPAAAAQSFDLSFGKKKKGTRVGISVSIPIGNQHRHGRRPPVVRHETRRFVPGHFETRTERVYVPGPERRVWVQPVTRRVYDPCGGYRWVTVQAGYWKTIQEPGCYETIERRVWVPAHYEIVDC
jgi:hypothetical protein